jgi:DNA-directed RNA polymerase subunit beta'
VVEITAKISVRLTEWVKDKDTGEFVPETKLVDTTVGRALLSEILPKGLPFANINKALKKKEISRLINASFRKCGLKDTVVFADKLLQSGFRLATRAGISIAIDDMLVPKEKPGLIERAEKEVKEIEQQYVSGLVTAGERYNKVVDIWGKTGDEVGKVMMAQLSKQKVQTATARGRPGVVQLHLHDGRLGRARLGGADPPAGRHARPDGQARRLDHRDADHGELPRRPERAAVLHLHPRRPQGPGGHGAEDRELGLPDAPPGRRDAGPGGHRGRLRHAERHEHARAGRRRRGHRVAARPHPGPRDRHRGAAPRDAGVLLPAGTMLDEDALDVLEAAGVDEVKVRTPLTCDTRFGICAKCYGRDLGRGGLVNVGEAVGVIAAQSIGEPGTQLTMRTFHIGGAASRAAVASSVDAKSDGIIGFNATMRYVTNGKGELVVISRSGEIIISDQHGRERERHKLPYGATLNIKPDQQSRPAPCWPTGTR